MRGKIVLFFIAAATILMVLVLQPQLKNQSSVQSQPVNQSVTVTITPAIPPSTQVSDVDYTTWPVQRVCLGGGQIPNDPTKPTVFLNLGDRTYIYKNPDGSLFRGTQNNCESSEPKR